jgi:hypothetical protein
MSFDVRTAQARPDTHEMVVVHRVFREGYRELPGLFRTVPEGDTARAAVVVRALTELSTALHHHHTSEDETLWPLLLDRVLDAPEHRALVLRMEEQHERVAALIERVEGIAAAFVAGARPEDGERLATAVEALSAALDEHLHDEEVFILPLAEQHLTVEEWEAGAERARASIPPDRLLVQLGYILSHCSPAEARDFTARLPLPARLAWRLVGRRAYRRERAQLLGR